MKQYCSYMVNFLRFRILDEGWFLVFGVPNAKYGSALRRPWNSENEIECGQSCTTSLLSLTANSLKATFSLSPISLSIPWQPIPWKLLSMITYIPHYTHIIHAFNCNLTCPRSLFLNNLSTTLSSVTAQNFFSRVVTKKFKLYKI